jgi:2-polyprenyl-3-methyl-5-hydroxy-6-metoxy-1,4-benzoquinol methylase
MWDVVEHTGEPRRFVKKAYEMLSPGGLLVLATPNVGGLLNKVSELLYRFSLGRIDFAVKRLYVLEHAGYFSDKTLRRLVEGEGFVYKKTFLTETDLERYRWGPLLKVCLKGFFVVARILRMQNRVIVIAQKPNPGKKA